MECRAYPALERYAKVDIRGESLVGGLGGDGHNVEVGDLVGESHRARELIDLDGMALDGHFAGREKEHLPVGELDAALDVGDGEIERGVVDLQQEHSGHRAEARRGDVLDAAGRQLDVVDILDVAATPE